MSERALNGSFTVEELPSSWAWAMMDDIAEIVGGSTPSSKEPEYWDGDVPWLGVTDLTGYSEKYIAHGARSITQAGYDSCSTQMVPAGTVLFSSRAPIGYVAIAAQPLCTSQGFKSFVLTDSMNPEYVYWYLRSVKPLAEQMGAGVTFKELSGKAAARLPIPVPPREEQDRIVEAIERFVARVDIGARGFVEADDDLRRLRAAVLAAASRGSLVELPATDEDATDLLAEVLAERRASWERYELERLEAAGKAPKSDAWKAKYKEPVKPVPVGLMELPARWAWATVDQLATLVQYGTSAKTSSESEAVPVLRMGNIAEGRLDFSSLKYLPSTHSEFPELLLDEGDVLFNRTNSPELVGKAAIYEGEPAPCSFASYLIRVRMTHLFRPELLVYFLSSPFGRAWVKSVVSQQVGQANVNGTKLRSLTIPLPSRGAQSAICNAVRRQMEALEEMRASLREGAGSAGSLKMSVLHRAFTGRLAPQLDGAESASELLARIETERADQKAERKSANKRRAAAVVT